LNNNQSGYVLANWIKIQEKNSFSNKGTYYMSSDVFPDPED